MSNDTKMTATEQEDMAPIQNLDQFAMLVAVWFDNAHAQGKQLLNIPDSQPAMIDFNDGQGEQELILTGDMLTGFKAGVIAMASTFGELPFGATVAPTEPLDVVPQGKFA